jgi:hypothetical protein
VIDPEDSESEMSAARFLRREISLTDMKEIRCICLITGVSGM